jgi:hypothetical protein
LKVEDTVNTRTLTCKHCGSNRTVWSGAYLRKLRLAAGVGLREAARQLELTPGYLCDIELERRNPTVTITAYYEGLSKENTP